MWCAVSSSTASYSSSNLRKHTSANPLQQLLLRRFHGRAADLLRIARSSSYPGRPLALLDAGCGEGISMRALLGGASSGVVGLDGSVGALHVARQIAPARPLTAGDLLALPFPDRRFDVVICMEVLEHLPDPERGLAELCRVSSRWLLLSVPNEPLFRGANFLRGKNVRDWGNDAGHVNHWSARGFRRFVAQHCEVRRLQRSFPWTLALCCVA
jgi:2-polyprenyl-3-methyl-5-hydroxy-6-metoxy-1,4-benzoquinol methylase